MTPRPGVKYSEPGEVLRTSEPLGSFLGMIPGIRSTSPLSLEDSNQIPAMLWSNLPPEVVEKLLALGGRFPGFGAEAQIDAPPLIRDAAGCERGHEALEIDDAGAERPVRAGKMFVEGAVGIVEVQMGNFALE